MSAIQRFMPLLVAAATAAALAAIAVPSYSEDGADLILQHGVFYPVHPAGRVEGSLAMRGGRIVYLGPAAGALAWKRPETRVIDLAGRAVTPGLIDAHSHLLGLGESLEEVDLTGAPTYEEVITRVKAAARDLPPGTWVRGRGW
ncbi:MAG TPA: amidohydrolase family protein, partial [Thermoanaerobaculia bacterium]|nr:amidohydrolase family protein [Thermoanaerobaculia bacterium]